MQEPEWRNGTKKTLSSKYYRTDAQINQRLGDSITGPAQVQDRCVQVLKVGSGCNLQSITEKLPSVEICLKWKKINFLQCCISGDINYT